MVQNIVNCNGKDRVAARASLLLITALQSTVGVALPSTLLLKVLINNPILKLVAKLIRNWVGGGGSNLL